MRSLLVEAKRRFYALAGALEGYEQPALIEEVSKKQSFTSLIATGPKWLVFHRF
jgi:hypothetical protein